LAFNSIQILANPATIIYWIRGDGEKVTGRKDLLMGSRSWLFSDGEICAAALLSPHCFPKPPHAANWHVYYLRLSHIESGYQRKRLSDIGNSVGRGCPRARRVTRMNKIHAAGLSIVMSRAGDANARKPA